MSQSTETVNMRIALINTKKNEMELEEYKIITCILWKNL